MNVPNPGLWWRARRVWRDPARAARTLASFAQTETDGGEELAAASLLVDDPRLRVHLARHAADELRHGELFRRRAEALLATLPAGEGAIEVDDKLFDLSRGRGDVTLDAHGFLGTHEIEATGEVAYLARVHVAEQQAAAQFALHRRLVRDAESARLFDTVLADEEVHVAYTRGFLDRWSREGRRAEVEHALKAARGSRLLGAWRRLGVVAGAHMGKRLLWLGYFTVAAPFGLIARSQTPQLGLRSPSGPGDCRSQH